MAGRIVPSTEVRAYYDRTWMNREDNGGGDLLRHAPQGFAQDALTPQQVWRGSDVLASYGFGGSDDGGYWKGSEGGWVTTNRTWSAPANLPAVGRATSLIADTIAGLPWRLMRDRDRLALPAWLADPHNMRNDPRLGGSVINPWSAVMWRAQVLISLLWWGDAFLYVPNNGVDGAPAPPAFVFNPSDIDVVGPVRALRQNVEAGIYVRGDYTLRIPDGDVIHLRGEGPYDEDGRGLGVLARYATSIGLLSTIDAYGALTFGAGVPAGYLKVNTPNISDDQAEALRSKWMDKHGVGGRGIAVLNNITEFHPIAFSPVDAALIDSKRLSMLDIALAFGIPPHMLGLPAADDTYANVESRMIEFSQFGLLPWCRRVESGLDGQFPLGTALHIDLRGLMRADTATRTAAYHLGLTDGWMTPEEVRDLEDLPPMTPAQRAQMTQRQAAARPLGVVPSIDQQATA